jgi:hypothetical protein
LKQDDEFYKRAVQRLTESRLLSTAHISPFYEYYDGASFLKLSKGGYTRIIKRGIRGRIKGFSSASRRRLMTTIGKIRRDAELPLFITLTYPDKFVDPLQSKIHIDTMLKRSTRKFSKMGWIWKLEPQDRGAPHYHLLVWGVNLEEAREFIPNAWFEIAGGGDIKHLFWHQGKCGNGNTHCVQRVNSFRGVWAYAAKYLGKTFQVAGWGDKWTGRYWGVGCAANIPFGEMRTKEIEYTQAVKVMRLGRRFAGIKKHKARRSQTIFCDANQWVDRLLLPTLKENLRV